jgi:protein-L-isoaspartate(D-aspartate) O-methyltransferase
VTIVEDRPAAGHEAARKAMIDSQLRTSGVNAHDVLARMGSVPREKFVPAAAQGFAYMDRAIPLEGGRYLAPPLVQGLMLQEARPERSDKALLVGGGSGYLAELLRPMVGSLEVITPEEAAAAPPEEGGFSLLVIDGAIEQLPDSLSRRLAGNGRVVTGWLRDGITRLATGRVAAGEVALLPLAEIGIPALPEFARPKGWSF